MLIEKFGTHINTANKIKVYRIVGEMKTAADGTSKFIVDETKIAQSYKYILKYNVGEPGSYASLGYNSYYNSPNRKWYDSRYDAEDAAIKQLTARVTKEIENLKNRIQTCYESISNIKSDLTNCGGKPEKVKITDEQVQSG